MTLRSTPVLLAFAWLTLTPSLASAVCGDGQLDPPEQCDDGNAISGDGCTDACLVECPSLQGTWSSLCFPNPGCEPTPVRIADDGAGNLVLADVDEPLGGTRTPGLLSDVTFFLPGGEIFLIGPMTGCQSMTLELYEPGSGAGTDLTKVSSSMCGDAVLDAGEDCDDGNFSNLDLCSDACEVRLCGNGTVDPGEECDDGNFVVGDLCTNDCTDAACGNDILEPGEECDDGNAVDGDGCSASCEANTCGDSATQPGEECDDGNVVDGDGCSSLCQLTACGNGTLDPLEQCDDGNAVNGDGCRDDCRIECASLQGTWSGPCLGAVCEEDVVVEITDDGAGNLVMTGAGPPLTGTRTPGVISDVTFSDASGPFLAGPTDCQTMSLSLHGSSVGLFLTRQPDPFCGDGSLQAGEECDDGNASDEDACLSSCATARCGDGFTRVGVEQCDDGNLDDGDGCESSCLDTLCADETTLVGARISITSRTTEPGDEKVVLRGRLVLPLDVSHRIAGASEEGGFALGSPVVDPAAAGVQLLLEGESAVPIFDLTSPARPIHPAAAGGCSVGDRWTVRPGSGRSDYANRSGAIDPPVCTAGSANGLTDARFVDRGARTGEVRFVLRAKGARVPAPGGTARLSVGLGADFVTASACGRVQLACSSDQTGRKIRCK